MRQVVLIGCGAIAKKHIQAIAALSDRVELAAVCDVSPERADTAGRQYAELTGKRQPAAFESHEAALAHSRGDIAAIATSSYYHHAIAIDCLAAGRHTMIEKPVALSSRGADDILTAESKAGVRTSVCYVSRFYPHVAKVHQVLASGEAGRVFHLSLQVNWNRNNEYYNQAPWRGSWIYDGGALMNQCTHGLDLVQWLAGAPAKRVSGTVRRYQRPIEAEDFAAGIVEFEGGTVAVLHGTVNVHPRNHDATLSIFAEHGTFVFGGMAMDTVSTWKLDGQDQQGQDAEGGGKANGHTLLWEDFVAAIDEQRRPAIDAAEAKKSLDIALGIYRSAREGRPVELPTLFSTAEMQGYFPPD